MTDQKRNSPAANGAEIIFLNHKNNSILSLPQVTRIAEDPVMQMAFQKIYDQGPRICLELISTLAEKNIQAVAVEKEIKRFALLPPGALRAIGCDQIRRFHPLEVPQ